MTVTEYVKRIKKAGAAVLMTTTLAATLTGAAGFGVGIKYQQGKDEPTISSYRDAAKNANEQLAEKEGHEGALNDFLQDLRMHLPSDVEVEQLFKAGDLHSIKDPGATGSLECCKAETHRLVQLFEKGDTDKDPSVRVIGEWLRRRCPDYFKRFSRRLSER